MQRETYLCWWYKLKSMSDSAWKHKHKETNHFNLISKGIKMQCTLSQLLYFCLFELCGCVIVCNCRITSQWQREKRLIQLTCKRLPSPKCRTSRIVSDWMKAVKRTTQWTFKYYHHYDLSVVIRSVSKFNILQNKHMKPNRLNEEII